MYEAFTSAVLKDIKKQGNTYPVKEQVMDLSNMVVSHETSLLYPEANKLNDLRSLYVLGCLIVESEKVSFNELANKLEKGEITAKKHIWINADNKKEEINLKNLQVKVANADFFDICRPTVQEGPVVENLVFMYRQSPNEAEALLPPKKRKQKEIFGKNNEHGLTHGSASSLMQKLLPLQQSRENNG